MVFVDSAESLAINGVRRGTPYTIDGRVWQQLAFSNQMVCDECGRDYPPPEPRLYSFNSPLGACPECEGFGNVIDIDMDLVVPDPRKSLREGAIAPWNTPAYAHELEELIALAGDYDIPLDVPFKDLTEPQLQLIREGVPERKFGGLRGSSPGSSGENTKCTSACFSAGGEVTDRARCAAARGCGPRHWRRKSAGKISPRFAR